MNDFAGFTDPARSGPLWQREAVFWRCKGADTGPALAEQKAARLQSAQQFQEQMALQQQQFAAAQAIKPVTFAPPAPVTSGDPDVYNAGLDAKRAAKRRFGPAQTILAPPAGVPPMGGMPVAL